METLKIAIIIASTRPQRVGGQVGRWVYEQVQKRDDAVFELIDLKDWDLPFLDEPVPPSQHKYSKDHTKRWAAKIEPFDGFVFVTPEYNHGTSAALKNALDFLYKEWNNKAAGFVGYGSTGGSRAVEQLRMVMGELQIADVRDQVALSLYNDFENFTKFKPQEHNADHLSGMLDQLIPWARALRQLRSEKQRRAEAA